MQYNMRLVTARQIRDWAGERADAAPSLLGWLQVTKSVRWQGIQDVRRSFSHADPVKVASGNTVTIFNIAGNRYRLITAIYYNQGVVFTLRFLTHAEYDKGKWKRQL